MAKQQIQEDLDNIVKQAIERKDELFKELDAKILDINDNIATLNDIRNKTEKCASYNEVSTKMEFVDLLEELFREGKQSKIYKSFKLTENEQNLALPSEIPKQLESAKVLPIKKTMTTLSVAEGKLNHIMLNFHFFFFVYATSNSDSFYKWVNRVRSRIWLRWAQLWVGQIC